jgi:hypothetical protein
MPFTVLTKVPVVQNIEPARLSLFLQMAAAIVLAVGLDRVRASGWRLGAAASTVTLRRTAIVGAVGVLTLLPLVPRVPITDSGHVHIPALFTSSAINAVKPGSLAMTYPFDMSPNNDPMMWQVASGMRFRMLGGEVFVPAADGFSTFEVAPPGPDSIANILMAGTFRNPGPPFITPVSPGEMRDYIKQFHIDVVFVDPNFEYASQVAALITAATGHSPQHVGGMEMWNHL